jgi:hypothetical protein
MSYSTSSKTMTPGTYAEPEIYYAEYPCIEQQRRYGFQGAIACLFVTSLILVALAVS